MNRRARETIKRTETTDESMAARAADMATKVLRGEISLRELAQVPAQALTEMYTQACEQFAAGEIVGATRTLLALAAVEPREPTYWFGLGGCQQARAEHQAAVRCFAVAALLDSEDPLPHLFAAQSWLALGERSHANAAVEAAYGCALGRPDHTETLSQALRLREAITAEAA